MAGTAPMSCPTTSAPLTLGGPRSQERVYAQRPGPPRRPRPWCHDRRRARVRCPRGVASRSRGPARRRRRRTDHRPRPLAAPPNDRRYPCHQPEARPCARVDKPGGTRRLRAGEGSYVGKTLHVNGGESLSLQWHHEKDETIVVLSGHVEIHDLARARTRSAAVPVAPGASVTTSRPAWCTGCEPHRLRPRRSVHGRAGLAGGDRPPRRPLRPSRHQAP